jgi:hypothetical protein
MNKNKFTDFLTLAFPGPSLRGFDLVPISEIRLSAMFLLVKKIKHRNDLQ